MHIGLVTLPATVGACGPRLHSVRRIQGYVHGVAGRLRGPLLRLVLVPCHQGWPTATALIGVMNRGDETLALPVLAPLPGTAISSKSRRRCCCLKHFVVLDGMEVLILVLGAS